MSTSQNTSLSKPITGQRVPPETFAYFRARAKQHAYNLVMGEFLKSGLTRAELARRLGKGADQISRMLGGPGNWTIATASDLLFAIKGGAPTYGIEYPLDKPARNYKARERFFEHITTKSSDNTIKLDANAKPPTSKFFFERVGA